MKSARETLEYWYKFYKYGCWSTEDGIKRLDEEYLTIKNDLDRLEKLEIENRSLSDEIDGLNGIIEELKSLIGALRGELNDGC